MQRVILLGRTQEELGELLTEMGEPSYRAQQVMQWIYQHRENDFSRMTNLPSALRHRLRETSRVNDLQIVDSSEDGDSTEKIALQLSDGEIIESVLIRRRYGNSVCLSTQVGCPIGCPLCASGMDGFTRDLTAAEITGQWFEIQRRLDPGSERISHVVFMGSGEPLLNYSNTLRAVRLLGGEDGAGISYRRITLSTVGLVPEMKRLAREDLPVTLAVSLHAPNDYLRDRLVPINEKYPLEVLIPACKEYAEGTGRRVSFEYAMIEQVNDYPELARELAILLADVKCHINLIPLNPVPGSDYSASSEDALTRFYRILTDLGLNATVRRSSGLDIDAGCGQLRRRITARERDST